jgi:hypothetical protein
LSQTRTTWNPTFGARGETLVPAQSTCCLESNGFTLNHQTLI